MIKVMTKNHPHQPRFQTQMSFSDNETEQAFAYAEKLEQAYWAVKIMSKPWYSKSYSEIRTRFNGSASTM